MVSCFVSLLGGRGEGGGEAVCLCAVLHGCVRCRGSLALLLLLLLLSRRCGAVRSGRCRVVLPRPGLAGKEGPGSIVMRARQMAAGRQSGTGMRHSFLRFVYRCNHCAGCPPRIASSVSFSPPPPPPPTLEWHLHLHLLFTTITITSCPF